MDYRVPFDALDTRYGVVVAEAIREEIRKVDNGGVVYFSCRADLAGQHAAGKGSAPAEFKRAA